MASLYEMAMGPQQSFYDDYQQVQQDKAQNQFNQFKLADLQRADQARPLMGRALQGDKASLAALAGLDPQSYLDVGKFQSDQATTKRQLRESDMAFIGKAVANADTPEKYAQVMDYLQSQGFDVDEHDRNFANRGAIMDATATGGQAFTLSPGASRYDSKGNLIATAPGRAAGDKRRTQVVTVGGRQVLTDLDTGDTIRDLGVAPVRGKPGLNPTEFKALRESENNHLNLGQTIKNLEQAAQLAPKVFEGFGAGAQTFIGTQLPYGDKIVDGQKANDSALYKNLMTPEAINNMAATLKGATTDFELSEFKNILSDPNVPNNIKIATIDRMLSLARSQYDLEGRRIQELKNREQASQPGDQQYPGADGITPADQGGTFDNGAAPQVEIPQAAVEQLVADDSPEARAEFDAVFGQGAAEYVLGQ